MSRPTDTPIFAFAVAVLAIGCLSAMDAVMKALVLAIGAWPTLLWRSLVALALVAPFYLARRTRWPTRRAMRYHLLRGLVMVPMSFLFFWGLAYVPMAQAIALAFVAPLIALVLAALLLGEKMGRRTISGSVLAFLGVLIIFFGQTRADLGGDALTGSLAILASAVFYAFNIVLMRVQALNAKPLEIAFFQFGVIALLFWALAPLAGWPAYPSGEEAGLVAASLLSIAGMLLFAWAYARAGAGYLSASEYSGFLWATLFGWIAFGERVSPYTVAGAGLILAGCWIAARAGKQVPLPLEPGLS